MSAHAETLFYLTPDLAQATFSEEQLNNIKKHIKKISILAPQIYQLNDKGFIFGELDKQLLDLATQNHTLLMPLVVNADFKGENFHRFLQDPNAQMRAINKLISLCQQFQFYGVQFDFENISRADRTAYSQFTQLAANYLHRAGYKLSVAVLPRYDIPRTAYDQWFFDEWSGGYDYKALAKAADFLSIMTYDQHTTLTTPGPIAAYDWTNKIIRDLLTEIPANKISLGMATYSGLWTTEKMSRKDVPLEYQFRSKRTPLKYPITQHILKTSKQNAIWNKQWQSSYAILTMEGRNAYLFIEDTRSFKAKLQLAKRYHLHGISVWKLGYEDPRIWQALH